MQTNFIIEILGIKDENINLLKHYKKSIDGVKHHVFELKREKSPHVCPICGKKTNAIHDYYKRKIKHIPIAGYNSIIIFHQRRYRCSCGKRFNEENLFVGKGNKISNTNKLFIMKEMKYKQSFTDIAKRLNISISTVIRHFTNHFISKRVKLPEVLCIDEFRGTTDKSKYSFIMVNHDTGEIIDLLSSRKKKKLLKYFRSIPLEERENVQYVIMDLWIHYKDVVKEVFPNATIIADTFHFIRHVYWVFNSVRTRIMNDSNGDDYYLLKKYWKSLIKRYDKLSNKIYYSRKFKKPIDQKEIVDMCLNISPELNIAHILKEELFKIVKTSTKDNIYEDLNTWIIKANQSNIPEFQEAVKPFINWNEEIQNSFLINPKTKKKYSNGKIEGINNFVKTIKRISFGFKSFKLYKAKIIYNYSNKLILNN